MPARLHDSRRRRVRRVPLIEDDPASHSVLTIRRMPALLPDAALVTFKFCAVETYALVAGTQDTSLWAVNSLYDPSRSGTVSAMGFDQWSLFYERYIVYASRIVFEFVPDTLAAFQAVVAPSNDATPPADLNQFVEQPFARYKTINGAWAPSTKLSCQVSVRALEGTLLGDSGFSANIDEDPAILKYWHLAVYNSRVSGTQHTRARISVYYDAKMYQRRDLLRS